MPGNSFFSALISITFFFGRKRSKASWKVSTQSFVRSWRKSSVIEKSYVQLYKLTNDNCLLIYFTDLKLAYPKMIDVAVPANMVCGLQDVNASL